MQGASRPSPALTPPARSSSSPSQYTLIGNTGSKNERREEKIVDGESTSLAQLERIISNQLVDAMTFTGVKTNESNKRQMLGTTYLPTALIIIAHGESGHVQIGKETIHIFDLLTRIRTAWVGSDWGTPGGHHPLLYVHFESCSVLKDVTTDDKIRHARGAIKDMVITGFDKDVGGGGVMVAQRFGAEWMHALSLAIEGTDPTEWTTLELSEAARAKDNGVFERALQNLKATINQPQRGQSTDSADTEAETLAAFRII
jgi:hypothetical protein